jgi:hypothetical protein
MMLTTREKPKSSASRIAGKGAIVRSLRLLVVRVGRFAHGRATSPTDRWWACRTLDALAAALAVADQAPHRPEGHPHQGARRTGAPASQHEGR